MASPTVVKVTDFPEAANAASTDQLLILYNAISNSSVANGTPSLRLLSVQSLSSNLVISNNTPANSSSNGTAGNISYDFNYFYICVSNNTWLRSPLSSW